jgi:hypothetical protein
VTLSPSLLIRTLAGIDHHGVKLYRNDSLGLVNVELKSSDTSQASANRHVQPNRHID